MWQSYTFAIYTIFEFSAMHCDNYSTQSCDLRLRAYVAWHVHLQVPMCMLHTKIDFMFVDIIHQPIYQYASRALYLRNIHLPPSE